MGTSVDQQQDGGPHYHRHAVPSSRRCLHKCNLRPDSHFAQGDLPFVYTDPRCFT